MRHVVFIKESLPLRVYLSEVDVWLDQPRFRLVVAQTRPGIELFDHLEGALHHFQRAVQSACNLFELVPLDLLEMLGNDLLSQGVLRVECFQLQQQAFPQIACANPDWIEVLNHRQRVVQVVLRILCVLRQLFGGGRQIAVLIQVTDDIFRDLAHRVGADRHAQLPLQMIGQTCW